MALLEPAQLGQGAPAAVGVIGVLEVHAGDLLASEPGVEAGRALARQGLVIDERVLAGAGDGCVIAGHGLGQLSVNARALGHDQGVLVAEVLGGVLGPAVERRLHGLDLGQDAGQSFGRDAGQLCGRLVGCRARELRQGMEEGVLRELHEPGRGCRVLRAAPRGRERGGVVAEDIALHRLRGMGAEEQQHVPLGLPPRQGCIVPVAGVRVRLLGAGRRSDVEPGQAGPDRGQVAMEAHPTALDQRQERLLLAVHVRERLARQHAMEGAVDAAVQTILVVAALQPEMHRPAQRMDGLAHRPLPPDDQDVEERYHRGLVLGRGKALDQAQGQETEAIAELELLVGGTEEPGVPDERRR